MNKDIYIRPAKWNSLRYKQEWNPELFKDLLYEELVEYEEANTLVDKLDAIGDLFFVAIGGLWKLGEDPYNYLHNIDRHYYVPVIEAKYDKYPFANDDLKREVEFILTLTTNDYFHIHIVQLIKQLFMCFSHLKCNETQVEKVILAICDSNDTKIVSKLASSSKGNQKSKSYIPPTKSLNEIAQEIQNAESQKI